MEPCTSLGEAKQKCKRNIPGLCPWPIQRALPWAESDTRFAHKKINGTSLAQALTQMMSELSQAEASRHRPRYSPGSRLAIKHWVLELMFRFTNIDEASINTVGQIWCTFAGALSECSSVSSAKGIWKQPVKTNKIFYLQHNEKSSSWNLRSRASYTPTRNA